MTKNAGGRRRFSAAIPLLIALLLATAPAVADTPAAVRLNLDEVLAMGAERNLSLKARRAQLEASNWDTRASAMAFLPTGAFTSSVTRVDDDAFDQANQIQQNLPPDWEVDPFLFKDTYRTSFTVNQEFPLNLHLIAGSKLARAGGRAAQEGLLAERHALILSLKTGYFHLLAARELLAVAEEGLVSAENRGQLAAEREELGMINRAERLQWDVLVAERRSSIASSRNAVALAEARLNQLLDQDLSTPLILEPVGDEATTGGARLAELDLAALTRMLRSQSPSVAALRAGNDASGAAEMMALSGLVPSLHFSFNYGWRENDTAALDDYETWSATALVRLPMMDLLGGFARYRRAAAEKRMNDYDTGRAVDELEAAVHAAWHEVARTRENRAHRELAVRQAQETFDLMADRYQLGHISEFDLVDVQTALTSAKAMAVVTRYNYYSALATLESLLGGGDRIPVQ